MVEKPTILKKIQAAIRYWQLYALLLPAVVYVFIFSYIPMYGLQIAFKDFRVSLGIWDSAWVGLKHFIRFVQYPYFQQIVWNTLSINLYMLAIGFPAPIVLALLMNEIRNARYKKFIQLITYAPHFISTVVICGIIILFTNETNGVLNHLLATVGIDRIDFMTKPQWFKSVYVLSGVWQNTGWNTIIYLAVLSNVSVELIEAARIDGAHRIDIIRHVNIPCIMPTIIILLILNVGQLFSLGFEKVWLLQNPLNLDTSEIISTYVYKVGIQGAQYSYASAIGLFNTSINFMLLILVNKVSRRLTQTALW